MTWQPTTAWDSSLTNSIKHNNGYIIFHKILNLTIITFYYAKSKK